MADSPDVAVAMDWGGTWSRAAVVDRGGEIQWQSRKANPRNGTRDEFLAIADELLQAALAWPVPQSIIGLGVAVAGPVDPETGTLYDPPNLRILNRVSLKDRWEQSFGLPVLVGNDADLASLGEFHHGAGKEGLKRGTPPRTLAYITLSTGIGGGVVHRGQLFLGAHGLASEVGHITIDRTADAPECPCGGRGCLESLASGTAIARIARTKVPGSGSRIHELADEGLESITSETVFRAAAEGDELALHILEGVVQALGIGLTNVLHAYNPDLVVLGGGVTIGLTGLGLLPRIESIMLQRAMSQRHRDVSLISSQLGDAAGLVGASAMVWQALGGGS